ncbi:MAG: 3-ketoacyl-CoA thiolase [uncultured Pseudonocardia sp.]|uniref:propanoyl-CoA C-acyltransferase n=1 Tax=uncultured Pseudonocardia sp. TaxID=211455 RepID=A0A6J4QF35_9PSEU|nr:MAG: 3-ketoacyl-CoA thiolase [uncultured Pseudonocardia sp.]
MTPFGRQTPSLTRLAETAVADALDDAGIDPRDVERVFFGNACAGLLQGQEMIRGQVVLRESGLLGSMIINVENACASSSTAAHLAVDAVRSGAADVVLAVGAEELMVEERARTFAAFAGATDTIRLPDMRRLVEAYALGSASTDGVDLTASPFMSHYAAKGRVYMQRHGATPTDLAEVVVASRAVGALSPRAQFTRPTSVEEVLAGRMIADPLHLAMCSPLGNGAAAVLIMSDRAARKHGRTGVRVRGTSLVSNDPDSGTTPTSIAAARAYDAAALDPAEIDLVEVHDAAASALPIALEDLGLVGPGGALALIREHRIGPDGTLPVNTGGGLLSRGHPVGATGCAQLVELADQLRGCAGARQVPGARIALAHNGGGVLADDEAVVAITILERTHGESA